MPAVLFCNTCKSTYQDETLVFCLNDGTRLVPLGSNSEATVQLPHRTNPARIEIPNSEPTLQINAAAPTTEMKNRKGTGLLIGLLVVGFLAVIAVAGAIGVYFAFGNRTDVAATTPIPAVTPLQTNTPNNANGFDKADALTKELEEKLNKLEKQLEDQKKANKTNPYPSQNQDQTLIPTAKVNSPNDGFLALRSAPSTETGAQLVKIPHGATVRLNNCEKNTVKIGGRNGRWCQVEYAAKTGWVFSPWLDY